jgi:peptidyl-tRNA hydrolase, PTH1 family
MTMLVSMHVIVGLGNVGPKYEKTRHNAGRLAVSSWVEGRGGECVASKKYMARIWEGSVGSESVLVLLPETFMNQSGGSVQKAVQKKADAERLIVVYDDIDLPLGTIRISFDRGSGGHNGIKSIVSSLKTEQFVRIRVGISPHVDEVVRKPQTPEAVLKWVLGNFKKVENAVFVEVCGRVGEAIEHIVEKGVASAMNAYN